MRIAILLVLSLMLSCNGSKQSAASGKSKADMNLNGNYKVVTMNGEAFADQGMELIFDPNTNSVNGSSGCNKLFGNFTQNEASISIEALGSTKMFCEGRMDLEKQFIQGLTAVNGVATADDGKLNLMNGDTVLMQLEKIAE